MNITGEMVGLFVAVFGAIAGLWWRVEARIDSAKAKAQLVADDFARYQTHVAETYITKQGLRETTEQIMSGIGDLKATVDHLNSRIDQIIENRPPRSGRQIP